MGYHWNWLVFAQSVPTGEKNRLQWLLAGLRMTLLLSAVSWVLALALGTAMGVLRTVPSRPLRAIAAIYVETFRNVPRLRAGAPGHQPARARSEERRPGAGVHTFPGLPSRAPAGGRSAHRAAAH